MECYLDPVLTNCPGLQAGDEKKLKKFFLLIFPALRPEKSKGKI
jgi:hypothetical protein